MELIADSVLLRLPVPRRRASDFSGFKARQFCENQKEREDKSVADSRTLRLAAADATEMAMWS